MIGKRQPSIEQETSEVYGPEWPVPHSPSGEAFGESKAIVAEFNYGVSEYQVKKGYFYALS